MFFHLWLFEIFVSSWLKQDVVNYDQISNLLTLHNLSSGPAAAAGPASKDYDLVLAAHDHRWVIIPLLAEEKDICFELYKNISKALLSKVFVLKKHLILL